MRELGQAALISRHSGAAGAAPHRTAVTVNVTRCSNRLQRRSTVSGLLPKRDRNAPSDLLSERSTRRVLRESLFGNVVAFELKT